MRRVFTRGLNIHGQCGLGRKVEYEIERFKEIEIFKHHQVESIYTNYASNFAILKGKKEIVYWGFNWNNRGFIRVAALYHFNKTFYRILKNCFKFMSNYPHSPAYLHKFEKPLKDISVGASYAIIIDENGSCYAIGDNDYGQLATPKKQIIYSVNLVDTNNNSIEKISAGYQHSLFLTNTFSVFGAGRYDKYQLGIDIISEHSIQTNIGETFQNLKTLNFPIFGEYITDVSAGKMHSLFLTNKGNVYSIGSNSYGQLGVSNASKDLSKNLVKIQFPNDDFIVKMISGDHHNLFLSNSGILYANGDNSLGQLDGDLESFSKWQCVPKIITLPSQSKILDIFASNNRSGVKLENGEVYYWGGIAYHPKYSLLNQPKYSGFNLMNSELGLPKNCKIVKIGLGYFHDVVLVEESLN